MRLFITGGAGFVGCNLAERLVEEGHEVTVFDNLSAGSHEFLQDCEGKPGFCFVQDDLLESESLNRAIKGHDAVFHLAANSNIPEGMLRTSNYHIDECYERARAAGAIGGKLLGAGMGGFLLLYCAPDKQAAVRESLRDLRQIEFGFEPEGSKIVYVGR